MIFQQPISIILAYIIDKLLGDPLWFPHPVVYMGKLISFLEQKLRRIAKTKKALKVAGFFLWLLTAGSAFFLTYIILKAAFRFNFALGFFIQTTIIWTGLAGKTLYDEARFVYDTVVSKDIEKARQRIGFLVGRDTTKLYFKEIIRAAVETVAENTVDGVTAPLFYAVLGGAPLMMAYKAINTLDSMVGYKNEKYEDLGYFSAKIDDLFNYIPARISLVGFIFASAVKGYDYKNAQTIALRDHKNHKSPNAGWPEAAVAGALGIQLGGDSVYFGKLVEKPSLGDKTRELEAEDIIKAGLLMKKTSDFMLLLYIMTNIMTLMKIYNLTLARLMG